jgi:hypothetical protein
LLNGLNKFQKQVNNVILFAEAALLVEIVRLFLSIIELTASVLRYLWLLRIPDK